MTRSAGKSASIAARAVEVGFAPRDVIARRRDRDGVLRGLDGMVRVIRDGAEVARLGPGEFFGELSVLDGGPRDAQVTAEVPTHCLALASWDFERVLREEPTVALAVLRVVAGRLREIRRTTEPDRPPRGRPWPPSIAPPATSHSCSPTSRGRPGSSTRWARRRGALLARHREIIRSALARTAGSRTRSRATGSSRPSRTPEAVASVAEAQRALVTEPGRRDADQGPDGPPHRGGRAGRRRRLRRPRRPSRGADRRRPATAGRSCVRGDRGARRGAAARASPPAAGEHRLKDLRPERIAQLAIDGLPTDFPPIRSLDARPTTCRRADHVRRPRAGARARRAPSSPTSRLLTLTGPGGTGKTRLALHVAAQRDGEFPDGIWYVPLATPDPALVVPAIAHALGIGDDPRPQPDRRRWRRARVEARRCSSSTTSSRCRGAAGDIGELLRRAGEAPGPRDEPRAAADLRRAGVPGARAPLARRT